MFHRRFDIFADDEASARELLGSRFRAALMHLADRWGATPWQAGHAWGKLMIAMPGEGDQFEPRSVATGTFPTTAEPTNDTTDADRPTDHRTITAPLPHLVRASLTYA